MRASETSHVEKSDWASVRYMLVGWSRLPHGGRFCNNLLYRPFFTSSGVCSGRQSFSLPPHDSRTFSLYHQRYESNASPDERCTPPWSSCLQGPHAVLPPQDTKVQPAPALPASESTSCPRCLPINPNTLLFLPQWFVALTFLVMLSLALLGLTNLAHAIPLNDKLLHFFCLGIATGVFYFIFDVEE